MSLAFTDKLAEGNPPTYQAQAINFPSCKGIVQELRANLSYDNQKVQQWIAAWLRKLRRGFGVLGAQTSRIGPIIMTSIRGLVW